MPAGYPVSGYLMYPRARDCGWRDELKRVHQLGGDTVVQLPPELLPRSIDAQGRVLRFNGAEPDPNFIACVDGGLTCFQAGRSPGHRVPRARLEVTAQLHAKLAAAGGSPCSSRPPEAASAGGNRPHASQPCNNEW